MKSFPRIPPLAAFSFLAVAPLFAAEKAASADDNAKDEHAVIGVDESKQKVSGHTAHPDAQWYGDAGLGLFLHWGLSSLRGWDISWPMIPGRPLAEKRIDDPVGRARIIREKDYNLNGKGPVVTPNAYWAMAKDFNPDRYEPEKWAEAAKKAGFTYVVLTTRHHEGFALWPSKFGDFNTKNFMGGRDLVRPYVEALRKAGLKVGLYYSPPDWHFDREFMNFMYYRVRAKNPELPSLDADLEPRVTKKSKEETAAHNKAYAAMVRGQIEELLSDYGKIDLIWFDGSVPGGGNACIPQSRIRELQPGILINPRLHGRGDFRTYERKLELEKPPGGWGEFCNTWTNSWTYDTSPFRSNAFILGQLVKSRSLGLNYLLGTGPDPHGELSPAAYRNMAVVGGWMEKNGEAIHGVSPLPAGESSDVPAVASGATRYLFFAPKFEGNKVYETDKPAPKAETLRLTGRPKPEAVILLGDGLPLEFTYEAGTLTVSLPASRQSGLVDTVRIGPGK